MNIGAADHKIRFIISEWPWGNKVGERQGYRSLMMIDHKWLGPYSNLATVQFHRVVMEHHPLNSGGVN